MILARRHCRSSVPYSIDNQNVAPLADRTWKAREAAKVLHRIHHTKNYPEGKLAKAELAQIST